MTATKSMLGVYGIRGSLSRPVDSFGGPELIGAAVAGRAPPIFVAVLVGPLMAAAVALRHGAYRLYDGQSVALAPVLLLPALTFLVLSSDSFFGRRSHLV